VAEAGLERADGELLTVVLALAEGFDRGSLDDEHGRGSQPSWGVIVAE
jgi:hypothetical protein